MNCYSGGLLTENPELANLPPPPCPYLQVGQERGGRNYENCL